MKKRDINFSIKDKNLNILAHSVLGHYINTNLNSKSDIKLIEAIKYILEKSDLYDINLQNKSPIDLIENNKLEMFYDIVYKYKSTHKRTSNIESIKNTSNMITLSDDYRSNKNIGIFNAGYLHSVIYIYIYLSKYKNLTILHQNDDEKELFINKLKIYKINLNNSQMSFGYLLDYYANTYYGLLPDIILWKDRDYYFIHNKFHIYLNKALLNPARFIYIDLLIILPQSLHAGCLLYDKKLNKLIRFEPYGVNYVLTDNELFDKLVKELFEKALDKEIIYLKPEDYMESLKWQYISGETNEYNKLYGDPGGYCLAWCFWWVGLKVLNPDIDDKELLKIKNDCITKHHPNIGNSYMIHIRSFANKLSVYKNNFLILYLIHIYNSFLPTL